ncbi:MAG: carboxypeptidase-like regulatory domain-containing protein [Bryobacterales bacterium]|nr:carboxypeptidase-like regulatory domain-containing protein [Bryobacteraceae bacterium]MDW8130460.1 carboxypeptidase-like regulatory domain-containing protein [Bryobacterales bacterium]
MRRLAIVCLTLLLGWSTATTWAQKKPKEEETGVRSVEGVVTDPDGNLVEGAVVQLKNTKTLQVRSYITGKNGAYVFHGLSQNVDYELKAEHQGRSSDVRTLSVFDSRRKAVINLRLKNP